MFLFLCCSVGGVLALLPHPLHREVDRAESAGQPAVPHVSPGVEVQGLDAASRDTCDVTAASSSRDF